MSDKYVFVEHLSNLNDVINQPLQLTQRLKFTCFDVSARYIALGASSGGIYIFTRSPCAFVKLLPSTEGSIIQLAISPDEKTIAFATAKGLVVLLEGCFGDFEYSYQQFGEHEGNVVTTIKWQGSEVYCGDNAGKVSVVTVASLLTKAIFQTPCATLMTLDSAVIQIDSHSKYLLISTLTRTYLCDTEKEQYRQIGKKLRDGPFGACFVPSKEKSEDVRIICSRPGARLWQANFDATVTYTHHFKNIASQKPASIIRLDNTISDAHLSLTDYSYDPPEAFNFGKLLVVAQKFVLTYSSDLLYVIDPEDATLLFWSNYFSNILDVKVVNSYLYILTDDFRVETVSISVLEDLILETLFRKQYFFCTELCMHFQEDVLSLIATSNRIHLITILEEKLARARCKYLLDQISPVLEKIRVFSKAKIASQGGVVVVDNAYLVENKLQEQQLPDTLQVLKELSSSVTEKLTEGGKNIKEKLQFLEEKVKKLTGEDAMEPLASETVKVVAAAKCEETLPFTDTTNILKVLQKHYELNKINPNVEAQRMKDLFAAKDAVSIVELLQSFVDCALIQPEERNQAREWCYTQFLKHLVRNGIPPKADIFDYTKTAFISLNSSPELSCNCGWPLPEARNKQPQFFSIGCTICRHLHEQGKPPAEITSSVPYTWKYVLSDLRLADDISESLAIIVQFGEADLFTAFCNKFTYDVWDEATKLLVKLKKGACLNCDARIEVGGAMAWMDFSSLMLQSLGGISTVKLLKRYSKWIPSGDIDGCFYQTCVFSTALDNLPQNFRKESVNLAKEMFSEKGMSEQMSELIAKYLHRKHVRKMTFDSAAVRISESCKELCRFCELPLNIEILEDVDRLKCGHVFHAICLNHNNRICCICEIAFD